MASSGISRAAQSSSTGSINPHALLPLPAIPTIVAEWSSLFPLVCHLASYRYDHQIVGDLALRGQLLVPLFPRLGVLLGIARLLSNNANFLDEASSKGGSNDVVYDVNWGSVFPCANGAASRILARHAISRAGPLISFPASVISPNPSSVQGKTENPASQRCGKSTDSPNADASDHSQVKTIPVSTPKFRRYQTLHVLHLSGHTSCDKRATWLKSISFSRILDLATQILLLASMVVLLLVGAYGTAIILFTSLLTNGLCCVAKHKVQRPPGYLSSNEPGDGCMLVSIHQNANVWQLYIGDRGIIDTLLNKTMITFAGNTRLLSASFHVAHVVQLLAVTYVAAQKGFDGIFLLFLMVLTRALEWTGGHDALARQWLRHEKVSMVARSFCFTGRMPLVGTVQMSSKTRESSWMDCIVAKCPRREAWLECLAANGTDSSANVVQSKEKFVLSGADSLWLELNVRLAHEGYATVTKELSKALPHRSLPV
jgi:hypothetical protein